MNNQTVAKTFTNRAKSRFLQMKLLKAMAAEPGELAAKYNESLFCSGTIKKEGNKYTSRYCGHRWCIICNRIRTAKLIKGYSEQIQQFSEPTILTLTVPNVKAEDLKRTIAMMQRNIKNIFECRRKAKAPKQPGIRKLECTYNAVKNSYHPHYHIIINSEAAANDILTSWLLRYPKAARAAQDIRTCYDAKEIFKYFTKLTSKTGVTDESGKKESAFYPEALNVIFLAIQKIRIIQPFGGLRIISDEIDDLEAEILEGGESLQDTDVFTWNETNWFSIKTGERLVNWEPSKLRVIYSENIKYLEYFKCNYRSD